jgi:hypothetical protein
MGVYHVVTELESAINANLKTHIDAVATETGKTLDNTFTVYLRERAETFYQRTLPGVGIWVRAVATGAKRAAQREWDVTTIIDYLFRGNKRRTVGEQVELTLDAMMRVIDGLAGTGTILGASEGEFATSPIHDINDLLQEAAGVSERGPFVAGFRLEVPIRQREVLT